MAFIDITGQKFNHLTVLERVENDKNGKAQWRCLCDCGMETIVKGVKLRNGETKSCGCLKSEIARRNFIDLTGQRFGRWTVLRYEKTDNHKTMFLCRCDCGTERLVSSQDLRDGSSKSCGCLRGELLGERTTLDLTNQQFGYLTAIEAIGTNRHGKKVWKCQCRCGNIINVDSSSLTTGNTSSCGCLKSKGEYFISQVLQKLQIPFEKQKTFEDLKSDKGRHLKFDFYLPQENVCIEFQGEQHYMIIPIFGEENYFRQQEHDKRKREYCKANNITLIEIPYTDREKISVNYFIELLKSYNVNLKIGEE